MPPFELMDAASAPPAVFDSPRVRMALRDGTAVEGDLYVVPGSTLADYFVANPEWVNVTDVQFPEQAGREAHMALHAAGILWASPVNGSVPVCAPPPGAEPRRVEVRLAFGARLRGVMHLPPELRLSDYLTSTGPFIPLLEARTPDGDEAGDVVVNKAEVQHLAEVDARPRRRGRSVAAVAAASAPARRSANGAYPADAGAPPPADGVGAARGRSRGGVLPAWLSSAAETAGLRARGPAAPAAPTGDARAAWAAACARYAVNESRLATLAADYLGIPRADLESATAGAASLLPERVARRFRVVPLRVDGRSLVVASSDPLNLDAENALRFAAGRGVRFELAAPGDVDRALDARYGGGAGELVSGIDAELAASVRVVEEARPEAVHSREVEAAPVVRLASMILRDAVRQGASDVHVEPLRDGGVVRFRVDGVLRPYIQMPLSVLNRVVSRFKVLGSMDIADRLRPQDGRARLEIEGRAFDLRLSTVPTRDAEKAVIRVLNAGGALPLEELGMLPRENAAMRQLLKLQNAIILVSGPTGSGKTTTLYAGLRELATGEVNVMTVEDPVEYELPGITQIQVEPRRGVTFASALRAILRQDPDVILVGEIRDAETAEAAVQASLTGHLVLATVHTNDAASAVVRLSDLGVDRGSVAASLGGVVAQRLVRRVCADCARPVDRPTAAEAELARRWGVAQRVRSVGCPRCGGSGFRGRIPITEVLGVSPALQGLIAGRATLAELEATAVAEGMRPLRESGLERVRAGETTLEEIERVLGEGSGLVRA